MAVTETMPGYLVGTWTIDETHTEVGFSVRHLMISKVRGSFTSIAGTITTTEDLMDSSAQLKVDLASIDTRNKDRDTHLRSGDFFDAEAHPTMTYRTTSLRNGGLGFVVEGDLTIKAVTRPVTLTVEFNGVGEDPWGGTRLGLSGRGEINRNDFDISFNMSLEGGGVMVGERVQLVIEVEAVLDA